ncbi:MAG: hypothetical protein ACJAS4_001437 [Bacteriovoracaceae bacterium]|jgi:hypothetical protein
MKIILMFACFLASNFAMAEEVSFNQLIGSYSVESMEPIEVLGEGVSIRHHVKLSANETIALVESIVQNLDGNETVLMRMECAGSALLDNTQTLISNVICTNGEEFMQRVDLSKVQDITSARFTAPVFSSLYGMTVKMVFTKKSLK